MKEKMNLYNISISGDTSDDLIKRFPAECEARKPAVVVFAIGVNDSRYIDDEEHDDVSLDQYEQNLQELIDKASIYADNIYCVWLTPVIESKVMPLPWSTRKYYTNERIKRYDQKLQEVAEKNKVSYIDVFGLIDENDLSGDGIHPERSGHQKIYEKVKYILLPIEKLCLSEW